MADFKAKELVGLLNQHQIGVPAQNVLEKCIFLCDHLGITRTELVDQLDAFLTGKGDTLTADLLGKFESHVRKETANAAKAIAKQVSQPAIKFNATTPQGNKSRRVADASPSTQSDTITSPSQDQESSSAFLNRQNSGQVVVEMNSVLGKRGHVSLSSAKPLGLRCSVSQADEDFENIRVRYRHMYTNLDERARALDKHIHRLQSSMCAMLNMEESGLSPVGIPSQDEVWVCGRICVAAATGKINKASVLLEGSRRDSGGRRVQLDLNDLSFSVFPGQIVLVRGINSSGQKMVAKQIVTGAMCPPAVSSPLKLLEYHHSQYYQQSKPLSVIVAAGPYTTSDNLNYHPLRALLAHIVNNKPDVVILVGPFVDISQPLLATGDVSLLDDIDDSSSRSHGASYHMVFVERIIRDCLQQYFGLEEDADVPLNTNIIMIPSLHDAHHEFVYPQPPFSEKKLIQSPFTEEPDGALTVPFSNDKDPKKRVHLLPNPCMFRVNEVLFGVTTNDVLFGLSNDEISHEPGEAHRITRLASHLLYQQTFVPQFPPALWQPDKPDKSFPSELDMRQSRHWSMKVTPDVLIIPSKLACLAKEVNGTVIVNPGVLTKTTTGGTVAEITIHPLLEPELRSAISNGVESMPHNVSRRSSVIISKI